MIAPRRLTIDVAAHRPDCPVTIVDSAAALPLSRAMAGKTVDQVADVLGMLFQVCRNAQSIACEVAAEHALGITVSCETSHLRQSLIGIEALHEHLWCLLINLPAKLDIDISGDDITPIFQSLRALINVEHMRCEASSHKAIDCAPIQLPEALKKTIHTLLFATDNGIAQTLLSQIEAVDWTSEQQHLPFTAGRDNSTAPDIATPWVETGPLARCISAPGLAHRPLPTGVLTSRLQAILNEVNALLLSIDILPIGGHHQQQGQFKGTGWIETARGRLTQEIALRVTSHQLPRVETVSIQSPTDINFGVNGSIRSLLSELALSNTPELEHKAALLVTLMNPCCAYELRCTGKEAIGASAHA